MKREKAEPSRAGFVSCFDRLTAGFFVEFVHFGDDLVVALRHVAVYHVLPCGVHVIGEHQVVADLLEIGAGGVIVRRILQEQAVGVGPIREGRTLGLHVRHELVAELL